MQSRPLTQPSATCTLNIALSSVTSSPKIDGQVFLMERVIGVTFMAPNFKHSIFDPLSCTGTQWIGDKVMIN